MSLEEYSREYPQFAMTGRADEMSCSCGWQGKKGELPMMSSGNEARSVCPDCEGFETLDFTK